MKIKGSINKKTKKKIIKAFYYIAFFGPISKTDLANLLKIPPSNLNRSIIPALKPIIKKELTNKIPEAVIKKRIREIKKLKLINFNNPTTVKQNKDIVESIIKKECLDHIENAIKNCKREVEELEKRLGEELSKKEKVPNRVFEIYQENIKILKNLQEHFEKRKKRLELIASKSGAFRSYIENYPENKKYLRKEILSILKKSRNVKGKRRYLVINREKIFDIFEENTKWLKLSKKDYDILRADTEFYYFLLDYIYNTLSENFVNSKLNIEDFIRNCFNPRVTSNNLYTLINKILEKIKVNLALQEKFDALVSYLKRLK